MKNHILQRNNWVIMISTGIVIAVFIGYFWINHLTSVNLAMVSMFEPDEGVLVPFILRMIGPAPGISQFLRQFIFYEYYFYGFPYFALSALVVLPLQIFGLLDQMPLFMLLVRQFISVLPMIAAVMFLVYLQDAYKSYRSPLLIIFLLSIPAVVRNNLWWHPDGLTILLVVLTIFFLVRDNLQFEKNFVLAAVFTGLATAVKYLGLYFFLAVGLTLILGLIEKRASTKRMLMMSCVFILIMVVVALGSNPFLLSHWARETYIQIFRQQTLVLSEGYGIVYAKGIIAALPSIQENFGGLVLFFIPLACTVWGAIKGKRKLLYRLIIAWFIPISITVLFLSHFKFQYWLPVALPVFSCIAILLPEKLNWEHLSRRGDLIKTVMLLIMVIQFGSFLVTDSRIIQERIVRAENNPRIQFFDQALEVLAPMKLKESKVYYDYRLYMPPHENWSVQTTFDLINYEYLRKNDFDVLLLLDQRIKDYINPSVEGTDPGEFNQAREFYLDADRGQIDGFKLIFRNPTGLIFIRDQLFSEFQFE